MEKIINCGEVSMELVNNIGLRQVKITIKNSDGKSVSQNINLEGATQFGQHLLRWGNLSEIVADRPRCVFCDDIGLEQGFGGTMIDCGCETGRFWRKVFRLRPKAVDNR